METAKDSGDALNRLLGEYAPLKGVADEMFAPDGTMRPVWQPFAAALAAIDPEELAARFARGRRYLHDAGVFFRQYDAGNSTEREWPLSPIPVVVAEREWATIEAGLIQRADLLEAIMADLYGPAKLVADGHLPAAVVAHNAEWLRPLVGIAPKGGRHLHFIAFDIARNPDGSWFVMGDRTQAPSGAGFALENRVATSRVFPDLFQKSYVHRLAGFFRQFRDALAVARTREDSRIAILTPGPMNDTYFEHAYIARYLGFTLLEGEDLTVQDGQAMVRTVEGPRPVDVIWRRLDAGFADPLELDSHSHLGTPGLVDAVRRGHLLMVNALGSGLLETRAFLAFMPRICRALRGEPLKLANTATWWCGQAPQRAYVEAHIGEMTVAPALSNRLPFEAEFPSVPGTADLPLAEWLMRDGEALVGQERVQLSTTPAWEDGRLVPRPMSMRVFLARSQTGWSVMKGGYARIGRGGDTSAFAIQEGGSVADVWVVSDTAVPVVSMVDTGVPVARPFRAALPSRAADNLFWLGRYVERAETATRLLRAWHLRFAETGDEHAPLLDALGEHLEKQGIDAKAPLGPGLAYRIDRARSCASRLRDRFSADGWQALNDLSEMAHRMEGEPGDDAARALSALLRRVAGLAGLVHENMYHSVGWRFLTLGRALERADAMAAVLQRFADPEAPEGALDLAIELGDSVMTHRRRFPVGIGRSTVVDLLALDDENPRAILYQLGEMKEQVDKLPGALGEEHMAALPRAVLLAHTGLAVARPSQIDAPMLGTLRGQLLDISELVAKRYFA